jgi:hypothetical protein
MVYPSCEYIEFMYYINKFFFILVFNFFVTYNPNFGMLPDPLPSFLDQLGLLPAQPSPNRSFSHSCFQTRGMSVEY